MKHCKGCVYLLQPAKLVARCLKRDETKAIEVTKVIGWCKQHNAKTLPIQPK